MSKTNNIKTYGFGVVAQGFHDYLVANSEEERLHTVIIKNPIKSRKKIKAIIEVTNPNTIKDRDTDVIVELISSSDEAYGIVAENLEIGKKVISANKKLIAENLQDLISKEKDNQGTFLYEGAVCGSIPIIRILNDFYTHEKVYSVSGIFNGSSNYILSKLFSEGVSYEEALLEAQQLGFAEANPSSDVGGFDALYKLVIITAHAFGEIIEPNELLNIGIETISLADVEFAKKNGLKIKLIANASLSDGQLSLTVLPTLVESGNELFSVENEHNGILIESEHVGKQFYQGRGAGSLPTGAVVYSDLKAIDRDYCYSYSKLGQQKKRLHQDKRIPVVLGTSDAYKLENLNIEFDQFRPINSYGKQFIGELSIHELKREKANLQNAGISVLTIESQELTNKIIKTSLQKEALTV